MSRLAKQALWRKRVLAFERSGLSRRAWCARAGVAVSTLDYWRIRLGDSAGGCEQALVPIVVSGEPSATGRGAAGAIEIDFGGGLRLRADADVDTRWLAALLRGLR